MAAERTRLAAAGFAMQEVVELRRRDRTLPGAPEVHFSVLRPQPGVMAEGRAAMGAAAYAGHGVAAGRRSPPRTAPKG